MIMQDFISICFIVRLYHHLNQTKKPDLFGDPQAGERPFKSSFGQKKWLQL